jgi:hypothetical protein
MTQPIRHSHLEAVCNAVIGIAIGQIVLWMFGLPVREAVNLNLAMLAASRIMRRTPVRARRNRALLPLRSANGDLATLPNWLISGCPKCTAAAGKQSAAMAGRWRKQRCLVEYDLA